MKLHTKLGGAALALAVGMTGTMLVAGPAEAAKPTRIKGNVADENGVGLAGIKVSTLAEQAGQWVEVDSAVSGAGGGYNVGKLDDGTYLVKFEDLSGAYATEYYNDAARIEEATAVDLTSGGFPTLQQARLAPASHLLGTITGSDGVGIAGAEVTAYVQQGGAWTSFRKVVTAADGTYDVGGLSAGQYTLGFRDPASEVVEYWNDKAAIADADPVTVPSALAYDAALATPLPPTQTPSPSPSPSPTPSPTPVAPVAPVVVAPTTTAPAAAVLMVKRPRIKGTTTVGELLRVTKGTWNPTSVTRKVQWLANGKKIKKATKNRLRLTSKLAGKRISVRVVASADGRTPVTVTTKRTKRIAD